MRGEIGTALLFEIKKLSEAFLTKSPRPYRRKPNTNPKIRTDGYFGKLERGLRCKNNGIQNSNPQMHTFALPPNLRKNEKSARYSARGGYFGKSERGLRCKNNGIQNLNPQMHTFALPPNLRKNEKSARYFAHGRHHGLYFDVLTRIYRLFYAKLTE